MSRVILDTPPKALFAAPARKSKINETTDNTYSDRLIKFIPAEVLAGYISAGNYTTSFRSYTSKVTFLIILILLCLTAIPIYYRSIAPKGGTLLKHIAISELAFIAWAYAIGGPIAEVGWHHPAIGGLLMVAFTFLTPLIKP
jgi:hypothetical protein